MITTKELIDIYGKPNETGNYLVSIKLPYKMKLSWDLNTVISRFSCHELVADEFAKIFEEILRCYGKDKIVELGLDKYGGCFNYRKMRGGSDYSRHSWGVAIDLDPINNQLRWGREKASFAKPEYDDLHCIFIENGFDNLGILKNYDWMHFQVNNKLNR